MMFVILGKACFWETYLHEPWLQWVEPWDLTGWAPVQHYRHPITRPQYLTQSKSFDVRCTSGLGTAEGLAEGQH